MENIRLLQTKITLNYLAREYMLRIETKGYLDTASEREFMEKLEELGIEDVNLSGTTKTECEYGQQVVLTLNGKLSGYEICEKRTSTAKN